MTEPTVARLIVRAPDAPDLVFPLELAVVRIGRSPAPQNDLVLADGAVSRNHARIFCDHTPFRLQDIGSSNGTALNDLPLASNEMHPLADGDVIAIGPFRMTYVAAVEAEAEPAVQPAVEPTVEPVVEPATGASIGTDVGTGAEPGPAIDVSRRQPTPPPTPTARPAAQRAKRP